MEPCRLPRSLRSRPFEEAIRWHDASALMERIAKCATRIDALGPRVNRLTGHAGVLRAALDESPRGRNHFAIFVFDSDDEMRLRRRDVVARPIVDERVGRHS